MLCIDRPVVRFGNRDPRRFHGFGRVCPHRSVQYTDGPPALLLLHFAWSFLDQADRKVLCLLSPHMLDYAILRRDASLKANIIAGYLQSPRLPCAIETPLDPFRTWFMAAALLSFDFNYGDLIRWLDGEYTSNGRDFQPVRDAIQAVQHYPTKPNFPPVDYQRSMRILTEGAPLHGVFQCRSADTYARIAYNNHSPLADAADAVREKFGKEEARSLHLAFPRFVAYFLPGLMISPISWVIRKGKGRIVVDCSAKLHATDTGCINDKIPNQGSAGNADECPGVHYGNAFQRTLTHIWNLRLQHPLEDILMHVDDIDAAFRRIVYHPDAATAFAYVFQEFLLIPVGQVFGGRNSPSFWCIPAELRAHLADCLDYSARPFPMEADMTISAAPTEAERRRFSRAALDARNTGIDPMYTSRHFNSMFVDDNILVALRPLIRSALRAAVGSAEDVFGNPLDTRRPPILQPEKWDNSVSHVALYLGLILDSRAMTVTLPAEKVAELGAICSTWLSDGTRQRRTPSELAKILGLVRHASKVLPRSIFFTLPLQHTLSDAIARSKENRFLTASDSRWWKRTRISIPDHVFHYLQLLRTATTNPASWTRSIGLLVPRQATAVAYSDAAYTGMGGWSPHFGFLWRLTRSHLEHVGFPMREILEDDAAASQSGHDTLHINTLEFIGLIINLWFCLSCLQKCPTIPGGYIPLLRADNTTAVSMYSTAARSRRRVLRNLCFLCEGLIALSPASQYSQISCNHIPGKENDEADGLSRPELFPTVSSVIERFSHLRTCQGFLVPYALLSSLVTAISSPKIEATSVSAMTQLLALEPVSFVPGANDTTSNGGYSPP